jgi:hypothetical protein
MADTSGDLAIDSPPINDAVAQSNLLLSDSWLRWFSTFVQTLQLYITPNGFLIQSYTATEIASFGELVDGLLIFNSGIQEVQVYIASQGGWKTFVLS